MTAWRTLATQVLNGTPLSSSQALDIVHADDDEVLALLDTAFRVRRHHHGRRVRIHVLQNAKSGVCPEDCAFCSQSLKFDSNPEQYGMKQADQIVEGAESVWVKGAVTYCIVTATRGSTLARSMSSVRLHAALRRSIRWTCVPPSGCPTRSRPKDLPARAWTGTTTI